MRFLTGRTLAEACPTFTSDGSNGGPGHPTSTTSLTPSSASAGRSRSHTRGASSPRPEGENLVVGEYG